LGWIGTDAAGFVEQLMGLATGPNRQLHREAAKALTAIDPAGKVIAKHASDPAQREAVMMALADQGAKGRTARAKVSRPRSRGEDVLVMQQVLIKYHRCGTGQFREEPAQQKELQELTGWKQSKVSRVMEEIFGKNPMARYKMQCMDDRLFAYLKGVRSDDDR
jgi:hypothetical protein